MADDDPLRLMYTSGTESRPKGAILSSRSLIAQYVSCVVDGGMEPDDIELHSLPLYHCAQMDCFLGPDIYLGATSVIIAAPDPATVLRTIATEKITKFFAPPTVWIALLRHPDFDSTDLTSLRKGYYGASAMPVEVLREIQERLPDLRLWNFYGQTEMAPLATILPPQDQIRHAGSAGRPALNVETRVVDDDGQPVPAGEVDEIVHRSPQATLGYWNDPDKTADAFRGGRVRYSRLTLGGGRHRGGCCQARLDPHPGHRHRALPRQARRLQGPQGRQDCGIPAEEPQRQAAQANAAH